MGQYQPRLSMCAKYTFSDTYIALGPYSFTSTASLASEIVISRCKFSVILALHSSNSSFTSLFPDGSNMCMLPFSLWTRLRKIKNEKIRTHKYTLCAERKGIYLTKIGGRSPSRSNKPLANAAAVFITRPSSLVLIFKSCRKVECKRRMPPPGASGYISTRKRFPRLIACFSPKMVRFPPF